MSKTLKLKISRNGQISAIYSDDLTALMSLGQSKIRRASHVEPCPDGWSCDLSPVAGPFFLGPFSLRSEALAAEVKFIEENILHVRK
jgi:hypothetical protein